MGPSLPDPPTRSTDLMGVGKGVFSVDRRKQSQKEQGVQRRGGAGGQTLRRRPALTYK